MSISGRCFPGVSSLVALAAALVFGALPVGAQTEYDSGNRGGRGSFRDRGTDRSTQNTGGQQSANATDTPKPTTNNNRQPNQAAAGEQGRGNRGGNNAQGQNPGRRGGAAAPGAPGAQAGQPGAGAKGGSTAGSSATGFTMTGKILEVSKGMADGLRTRKVDFDSSKAAKDPNVIILGTRRSVPPAKSGRELPPMASPL